MRTLAQKVAGIGLATVGLMTLFAAAAQSLPNVAILIAATILLTLLDWQRSRNVAYVLTNQRCFHLAQGSFVLDVRVRDIEELPRRGNLGMDDYEDLRARLWLLQRRPRDPATARQEKNQRLLRDLPGSVRHAVGMILLPGEELLWLDQPTPRSYFMHAPMDFGTACIGLVAGISTVAAAITLMAHLPVGPPLLLGSLGMWFALGMNLRRQIRGTAYALTSRRGFIVAPGPRVTQYNLVEMQNFQRTQNSQGMGRLAPAAARPEAGFHGVRDVKEVDDLIKGRATRVHSTEVVPACPEGRGDEVTPSGMR